MSTLGKVLLADDSPHAQRMGERILREEGYEVVTVTDGETAILRVKDVNPDVVIVDAFLPQVSGYDLCGFIKKQPHHAHVRVLLTSTALERVDEDQMYRSGADGQLKKPFEASVMLKSLKDLISGSDKDSKKKRSGSTFDLSSYPDEHPSSQGEDSSESESGSGDNSAVSPLKAWLEQHDSDAPASDADADPLGIRDPSPAPSVAAVAEQPSPTLSNPQLLRRAENEPEDLSLRNNPVARLRNVPPSSAESPSRLQSISGRAQEAEPAPTPASPSTRTFRMTTKTAEDEPLVKEQPAAEKSEQPRQRRSLLDALAEYENEGATEDPAAEARETALQPSPATATEPEVPVAEETAMAGAMPAEPQTVPAIPAPPAVAAQEFVEPPPIDSSQPEFQAEIIQAATGASTPNGHMDTLSMDASGARLDEEEIRAAVEIAVSASMSSIVEEVTRCVTMALESRYRQAHEAPADRASD